MGRRLRYLADTHALIWFMAGSVQLSPMARRALEDEDATVYASAASAWEITTKHRLGKLPEVDLIAHDIEGALVGRGFRPLPVSMHHAERAGRLEGPHRDPFDRMLIAQALVENLTLVSNETVFDRFGVSRLW